eukprot:TRINITY_DN25_c0_g1_i1.p2 TRINITY_DN25_c0_g1~~TRINITY_DN25_c0_g1_i1.p2  ORF type:complete len:350 (+),score=116.14 TRINITY_DN25_c0_g1_i1:53-1102(+)
MTSDSNKNFMLEFLLGGTSGVIAKTACAPLERIKIVLQTQHTQVGKDPKFVPYKGIFDAAKRIPAEQGFSAFWRGNFTNCIRYFPTQALNFAFKEKYQRMFVRPREQVGFAKWFAGYLAAGGAAGATSLLVVYPLDFSFTRLAADVGKGSQREFTGLGNCLSSIFKKDGMRGLYRGFLPSVVGIVVYRAGYFGFYDFSKQLLFSGDGGHSLYAVPLKFAVALAVDISSSLIAYPFDTVRRRLMMQSGLPAEKRLYKNAFDAAAKILKQEGFGGIYKGALTNSVRAIASALVLVLYDEMKHHLIPAPAKAAAAKPATPAPKKEEKPVVVATTTAVVATPAPKPVEAPKKH